MIIVHFSQILEEVKRLYTKVYNTVHATENMESQYPMLEDYISASEIITPDGSELLIYNTSTGEKKYPNRAVFNFLGLATGRRTFREITEELSRQSGESYEEIWPGLSLLAESMVKDGLLHISDRPFENPRKPPPSVEMVHRLENVSFETTRQCNLRCKHCYANASMNLEDELTLEEIKALIDQLADIGVLSFIFTGGEPLLHPHIFELIEYARKKPLSVFLFTNGTLLTPEIVEKLKELQVLRVNISIDGSDEKTHDEFRGLKGAYKKTIQSVKMLREAGIGVEISVSLHKGNYRKIKEILKLLKDLGVNQYKLWPITFSGRPEIKDIFITPAEFREVMVLNREFEFEELGKKEKEEFKYIKSLKNCGVGMGTLTIKCNGWVTSCPVFGEDVSFGNIRKTPVIDMWNDSPLLNKLRAINVFEIEPCKACEFAAACKGGCIGDIYQRSGKFTCYDEYVCQAFDVVRNDFIPVEVDDTKSSSLSVEVV